MRNFIVFLVLLPGCGFFQKSPKHVRPVEVEFTIPEQDAPPLQAPPRPGFLTNDVIEALAIEDVNNFTSAVKQRDTRWANACDRFNAGEELAEFKRGFDKLLNSLSTEVDVVNSVAIGPGNCLFRYHPSDYDISTEPQVPYNLSEYQKLEDRTVLQVPRLANGQLANISTRGLTLQGLTNTLRPILPADDMMLAAFENDELTAFNGDTYYDIVEQAIFRNDWLADENINIQRQFDDQDALMEGVTNSGVAQGSRLYVLLESINGRTRCTEDSSNVEADNINENPFVIQAVQALRDGDIARIRRSDRVFNAAARECIGDLPNGGHWYRIENAVFDLAVGVVPINVAASGPHANLNIDSQIRPGMCMECHERGIAERLATDLANHIQRNNFESDEKTIATDYMDPVRIQQYQRKVNDGSAIFLEETNNDPRDRDAANARVFNPFRDSVTVQEAAGKFGKTAGQYLDCLRGAIISKQLLGSHLSGGTVTLTDFAAAFPGVVEECNYFEDS